ncbi:MAG: signal peptidase II [Candidatus Doudnabacteria bacterium]|nr:signal peptidase II [Candidatus Doudnabacteria bacterium]
MENFTDFKKSESKKNWLIAFLFIFLVAADQFSKSAAQNIFQNRQFAFSLPVPVFLMYLIYFGVMAGLIYYAAKHHREFTGIMRLAFVLIFAGAFCNIAERIALGYVRDFIYIAFYHWVGIYNLADGYIILGIILLALKPAKVIDKNDKI